MIAVEKELERKLKQLRVHIDAPDGDTVLLRNVPANDRFFNKPRTNVLIKRARSGLPYLICVDEDLDYTGTDAALSRAFVAGHKQQGWRVLFVGNNTGDNSQSVIEEALRAVGFDGSEPELTRVAEERGNLLSSFATEVSPGDSSEPTIGHDEQIEAAVSCLLQWRVKLPLIAGESGVGKTNLTRAVARRLKSVRPDLKIVSIDLSAVMSGTLFESERESLLFGLLKELAQQEKTVALIEHLELALIGVPRGLLLLCEALDKGVRLIGTTLPVYVSRFGAPPLARRTEVIELTEMTLSQTREALAALRQRISDHHQIEISEGLLDAVVEAALSIRGQLPAKAISLLDRAATRAALAGDAELSAFDIWAAVSQEQEVCG